MGTTYTNYFDGRPISDGWAEHRARGSAGGVDYAVGVGTPILAPTDGQVSNIAYNGTGGHTVNLVSPNGYKTQFMHCSQFVSEGWYAQGSVIGYTGGAKGADGSGSSTGPHCHVHIITPNGNRVNMLDYVGQDFAGSVSGGNSSDYGFNTGGGSATAWAVIQQNVAAPHGYTGPIDGIPGPNTWRAMQTFLANNWGYTGPIDGDPGKYTWRAMQRWLAANYGYTGSIDGIPGPLTAASINRAGTPAPVPAPAPTLEPIKETNMTTTLPDASQQLPAVTPVVEAQPDSTFIPSTTSSGLPADLVNPAEVKKAEPVATPAVVEVKAPYVAPVIAEGVTAAANNIGVIIPTAKGRKIAYAIYVAVSFLITNTVVAFSTLEAPLPAWLKISLAVVGNSAVAFGSLAIANVDTTKKDATK